MPDLPALLDRLWQDYITLNPHTKAIYDLVADRGEIVINDHIALRTFDIPRVGIDALARCFCQFGYRPADEYQFPEKKLNARHYEHTDPNLPKVFISELKLAEFSDRLQAKVRELVSAVTPEQAEAWDFPVAGRLWDISFADYEALAAESEYAGWVAAHGFRANHFTVDVGRLADFDNLADFNDFIKNAGYALNTSGGEIKGSPEVYLEQSSTLAEQVEVSFTDGAHTIPACYYEFAKRYLQPDGTRFEGFVAQSADKIFESTDRRK